MDRGTLTLDRRNRGAAPSATMPVEYEPSSTNITCRYANGVKLVLDFLKTPFGDRGPNWITELGTCPVKFVGDQGWVETGDNGKTEVSSVALKSELKEAAANQKGLDVSAHARNFFDCVKSRAATVANPNVMRHTALSQKVIYRRTRRAGQLEQVADGEAERHSSWTVFRVPPCLRQSVPSALEYRLG